MARRSCFPATPAPLLVLRFFRPERPCLRPSDSTSNAERRRVLRPDAAALQNRTQFGDRDEKRKFCRREQPLNVDAVLSRNDRASSGLDESKNFAQSPSLFVCHDLPVSVQTLLNRIRRDPAGNAWTHRDDKRGGLFVARFLPRPREPRFPALEPHDVIQQSPPPRHLEAQASFLAP